MRPLLGLLLLWLYAVHAATVCRLSLLGDDSLTLPVPRTEGSVCSCEGLVDTNFVAYTGPSAALNDLCGAEGSLGPYLWDNIYSDIATTFTFTGADFVLDGALTPTGVLAANLDLSATNGPQNPLLQFFGVQNLVLRNLVIRNVTTSAPILQLIGCGNVTLQNVTFEGVRVLDYAGALVQAREDPTGSSPLLTQITFADVVVRSVTAAPDPAGEPAGPALISIAGCTAGCSVTGVAFEDVTLGGGFSGVRLASSGDGAQVTGITVTRGSCTGNVAALISVADSGGATANNLTLQGAQLQGGCVGVRISGASANLTVRGVSVSGVSCDGENTAALSIVNGSGATVENVSLLGSTQLKGGCGGVRISGAAGGLTVRNVTVQDAIVVDAASAAVLASGVTSPAGFARASLEQLRAINVSLPSSGSTVVNVQSCNGFNLQGIAFQQLSAASTATAFTAFVRVTGGQAVSVGDVSVADTSRARGPAVWVYVAESTSTSVEGVRNDGGPVSMLAGSTTPATSSAAVYMARCNANCAVSNVSLSGLTLDANSQAIWLLNCAGVQLRGVQLSGVSATRQNVSSPPFSTAVRMGNCNNAVLEGISLQGFTTATAFYGITVSTSVGVTAVNLAVSNYQGPAASLASALYLRDRTSISLNGYTCSGSFSGGGPCLFVVGGANATVSGASFTNNSASDGGGALALQPVVGANNTNALVQGSTFANNTAPRGGAISLTAPSGGMPPTLTLASCTFASNSARQVAGSRDTAFGGDMYAVDGSGVTITNCTFTNSIADSGGSNGGSLYLKTSATINGSTFINGRALNRGGAIYFESVDSFKYGLAVAGTRFENNTADVGGAVAVVLNNNAAASIVVDGCDFLNNAAKITGGALAVPGNCQPYDKASCRIQSNKTAQAETRLRNSRFISNNASMAGAVYITYNTAQSVNISGCEFVANNASESGAMYVRAVPYAEIRHSLFADQTATLIGAVALYSLHDHAVVHNTTFRRNVCNRNNVNTGSALYVAEYDGVSTDGTPTGPLFNIELTNSTFEDNFSSSEAGGATITRCHARLEDVIFRRNTAARRGGALYLEPDVGGLLVSIMEGITKAVTNATLRNVVFDSNSATVQGGALQMGGWHVDMQGVSFTDNSVNIDPAGGTDNAGGAVFATVCPSTVAMRNVSFTGNRAFQGGAIVAEFCSMQLSNTTFLRNTANGDGGALLVTAFSSNRNGSSELYAIDIQDSSFDHNEAAGLGGAIKAYWSVFSAASTNFSNNRASIQGGGVYLQLVPPRGAPSNTWGRFDGCRFTSNAVNNSGGALFHSGSAVQLYDCEMYDNRAGDGFFSDSWSNAGAGVFAMSCTRPMLLARSQLGHNVADSRGGGLALLSCAADVQDTLLTDNVAKLSGGGVAAGHQVTSVQREGPPLNLINCNVTRNTAQDEHGGGIHTVSVPLQLSGCTVANNSASQTGGGIYTSGARALTLMGSRLAGNAAGVAGGGLCAETCDAVQISGTDLQGNAATGGGGGLLLSNANCTRVEGLLLDSNTAARGGGALLTMASQTGMVTGAGAADGTDGCLAAGKLGTEWKQRLTDAARGYAESQAAALVFLGLNVTVRGNNATAGAGGGVLLEAFRGTALVDVLNAIANSAKTFGGALAVSDSRHANGTVSYVASSSFLNNTAAALGGAVALDGVRTHQQLVASNTTFVSNAAASGGALSLALNASVALHGCVMESNRALGAASAMGGSSAASDSSGGGSVYGSVCNWLLLNDTAIRSSAAPHGQGGGLYASSCGGVVLQDATIAGNTAAGSGGGVSVAGSTSSGASLVVVLRGTMSNNTAGAGMATSSSSSATDGSLPWGSGGAVYLGGAAAAMVNGTVFEGNKAASMAGAVGIGLECPQAGSNTAAAAPAPLPFALLSSGTSTSLGAPARLVPGMADLPAAASSTLQALGVAANRSACSDCWPALVNLPILVDNVAGGSGGALYSGSSYTLTVLCGGELAYGSATSDAQMAEVVLNATAAATGGAAGGSTSASSLSNSGNATALYMGLLPLDEAVRAQCFTPRGPLAEGGVGGDDRPNDARTGYGDGMATTPTQLVLSALDDYDKLVVFTGTNSDNLLNITAVDMHGQDVHLSRRLLDAGQGRVLLQAAADSGSTPDAAAAAGSGTLVGAATSSAGASELWRKLATLTLADGTPVSECWPGDGCRLRLPTNVAFILNMSVYDAFNQLANDTSAGRPVVRAYIDPVVPTNNSRLRANLLGNPTAQADYGNASIAGVRLRALKGDYSLRLEIDSQNVKVDPLRLAVTVPPCSVGEVVFDQGFLCTRCAPNSYSLDVDEIPDDGQSAAAVAASIQEGQCLTCPDNAICTGGAVTAPEMGYWHSAANSTLMHVCPNQQACRDGDDDAQAALVRCQERWHAYFGVANRRAALHAAGDGGASMVAEYLEVYRNASDAAAGDGTAVVRTPLLAAAGGGFDGFLLGCALWGLPPRDSAAYMQMQCMPGYTGTLCATCVPYDGYVYALDAEFNCNLCFNMWQTVLIGLAMFAANTLWLGFSVLMTFLADYSEEQKLNLPAADVLKVLIVHFQFFLIVTRLNMDWPASVTGLQSVLGSMTGTVKQVYAPSCLWEDADSATQATVQVLSGLLLPIFSVLLVMLLWTMRYLWWNQSWYWKEMSVASFKRNATGSRSHRTAHQASLPRRVEDCGQPPEWGGSADALVKVDDSAANGASPAVEKHGYVNGASTDAGAVRNGEHVAGHSDAHPESVAAGEVGVTLESEAEHEATDGSAGAAAAGTPLPPQPGTRHGSGPGPVAEGVSLGQAPASPRAQQQQQPEAASNMERLAQQVASQQSQEPAQRPPPSLAAQSPSVNSIGRVNSSHGNGSVAPSSRIASGSHAYLPVSHSLTRPDAAGGGDAGGGAGGRPLSPIASMARSDFTPFQNGAGGNSITRRSGRKLRIFKDRQALSFVDANMSLGSQLFLVLMVTSFILMPTWATEALSIFACYMLDTGEGDYPQYQTAVSDYGWWVRDMNQMCYEGRHKELWVPIGVVSVVVLCLAMPVICAMVLVRNRHHLHELRVLHVYGFLYRSYRERYFFWESVSQAQTLLLVVVEVFGRTLPTYQQALLLEVVLLAILMVNTYFNPLFHRRLTTLQLLSMGTICMTVALGMFTSGPVGEISTASDILLGVAILLVNCIIIAAFLVLFAIRALPVFKRKASAFMEKLAPAASQVSSNLEVALSRIRTRVSGSKSARQTAREVRQQAEGQGGGEGADGGEDEEGELNDEPGAGTVQIRGGDASSKRRTADDEV